MKRFRALPILLCFVATSVAARPAPAARWCAGPAARSAASRVVAPCVRKTVAFDDLPAELARLQGNCPGIAACPGYEQAREVKSISGPGTGNHLWTGSTSQSFDQYQQDGFVADAKAKAEAVRPPTKHVVAIEYLYFYLLCLGPPTAVLGARAIYARCGPADITD